MLFKQTPSKSIHKTKRSMTFAFVFFVFWSVFTCDCQSSTDKIPEKIVIATNDTECTAGRCSTVILTEDDYLFLTDAALFVRPLSLTIDVTSYVASNGTVAVCECLFYRQGTSDSQNGTCNQTIDDCATVRLDPTDVLHLSDGAVFVKSLSTWLDATAYTIVNGSIVVCECLNREANASFHRTCKFNESATMSTNCSTLTLGPGDYRFRSNAALYVPAWNATLNESFFSVTNDSVNVCATDCATDDGAGKNRSLQILWACLMVFVFELFASCGYCMYPTVSTNRAKCKIASFLYIASALMIFMHIIYLRVGYYDVFVVLYYELSFLAVVEFGMLSIMSSDLVQKFLERIGATEWSNRDGLPVNPMRMKIFYWCCLVTPFVVAYSFRSQELSSRYYEDKVSTSDYYYSQRFRESVPMFFLYDVVLVFVAANLSIFMASFFCYWRRTSHPNDWQMFLRMTYMMHLTFFAVATLLWIVGHSILLEGEVYRVLWPLFVIVNFFLSACISWFVFRDNTLNAIVRFFVIQ